MKKVTVNRLESGTSFPKELYHSSGNRILEENQEIREEQLFALRQAGISTLYMVESEVERKRIEEGKNFRTVPLQDLESGTRAGRPIYDMDNVLLLQEDKEITDGLKERLYKRGIDYVRIMKTAGERQEMHRRYKKYRGILSEVSDGPKAGEEDGVIEGLFEDIEEYEGDRQIGSEDGGSEYGGGPDGVDRRQHPRYQLGVGVTFQVIRGSGFRSTRGALQRGKIENISRGGICLVTRATLQQGDRIKIRLNVAGRRKIEGALRVVRKQIRGQGLHEYGAEFVRVKRRSLTGAGR